MSQSRTEWLKWIINQDSKCSERFYIPISGIGGSQSCEELEGSWRGEPSHIIQEFDFDAFEETNLHENEHFDPLEELISIVLCFAGDQDFVCLAPQIYAGEVNINI